MNAYVLRIESMTRIFIQFLLVQKTSITETRVVNAHPIKVQRGGLEKKSISIVRLKPGYIGIFGKGDINLKRKVSQL